nr:hypothetical protein Iba_chr02cCG2490 [Ipomoea batatas]
MPSVYTLTFKTLKTEAKGTGARVMMASSEMGSPPAMVAGKFLVAMLPSTCLVNVAGRELAFSLEELLQELF